MSEKHRGFRDREDYWNRIWRENKIFEADPEENRRKFFVTFPFPYMNGSLHLGHAYTSGRLDVVARYMRMKGFNVLFPWAWHWTGEAVMGVVHRLEQGDEGLVKRLIELDGVEPDAIKSFLDPVYLVKYFTNQGREDIIRYGLSIDWRREFHTTDLHPLYTKFVEWQIRTLYSKGLIKQGPYPVVWCPRDKSPTGDHDRLKGEGVRPEEYTLIKFEMDDGSFLVAGTFRPETIFGATNVWVKEDAEYVLAEVDNESWIISSYAAEKLSRQLRNVKILNKFMGAELIGRYVNVPYVNRRVPILPAKFVDPTIATGVVYSVPAHAPYDLLALRDLKKEIGTSHPLYNIVVDIEPISIIRVDGFGDYPAVETVDKLGVSSQMDFEKADEATHLVYSREYHSGVMKDNCLDLAGYPVRDAKEEIKVRLREIDRADTMYDLPEEVVCRCGTRTLVKIIEDQWSLKYSDPGWKNLAKEAVDDMDFYPGELRKLFQYYIDWYRDWPCTRKTGLGTPFPFDKSWIVETLTDSTVYMAFYPIAKYYNAGYIDPDKVDDDFFNYIFFGEGDLQELSKRYGVEEKILMDMRKEFLYWYPVDLRGSGKDLVGNHLTFFIFQHVALFPRDLWPRAITVNGFTMLNGLPMSKSKGNYVSLRKVMELYGADAVRVGVLTLADGLDDPDIHLNDLDAVSKKIESLPNFIEESLSKTIDRRDITFFDKLLFSQLGSILEQVDAFLSEQRIANAGKIIFYRMPRILREYISHESKPSKNAVYSYVEAWIKLLSLYAPYISEEIWHAILGKDSFIAKEPWPTISTDLIDQTTLLLDEYAKDVIEDIGKILDVLRIEATGGEESIELFVADEWKWRLLKEFVHNDSQPSIRDIVSKAKEMGIDPSRAASFGKMVLKQWFDRFAKHRSLLETLDFEGEFDFLKTVFKQYFKAKYPGYKLNVYRESEASNEESSKADRSLPLIPAIFVKMNG